MLTWIERLAILLFVVAFWTIVVITIIQALENPGAGTPNPKPY